MSATDSPPRCKNKKYLANNVHVSCIFCKNTRFILKKHMGIVLFGRFNKKVHLINNISRRILIGKRFSVTIIGIF